MKRLSRRIVIFSLVLLLTVSTIFAKDTFALVLSGGGARGIAHIPVLQELERRGIVPDYIIGTSMGALVGGLYSAGWKADELEDLILSSDILGKLLVVNNHTGQMSFVSLDSLGNDNVLVLQFGSNGIGAANGILDDQNINGFIRENIVKVLDINDFDDLPIKFRAIGTDITTGKEIIFDSGSLYTALRSSMSLPIVFAPVKLDEETYVMDGGLVNNLPVDVARSLGADIVLAVDVNDAKNTNRKINPEVFETLTGTVSAFSLSLNMINSVPQYDLADWVIVSNVNDFSTLDFNKADEILEAGRRSVYDNVSIFDKLEKKLKGKNNITYELYSERKPITIKAIEYSGLDGFEKQLNSYIGKSFDEATTAEFEKLLLRIKQYSRLKDLSYEFENGKIVLKPAYYGTMEGALSLGATGELGLKYNGENNPYFALIPNLSLAMQYHITKKSILSTVLAYHDTLTLQTRLSVPLYRNTYFYAGADFDYLNLSLVSMPLRNGHLIRNDLGARANTGLFWNASTYLVAELSLGFDYIHLSKLSNPIDESNPILSASNHGYTYLSAGLGYNTINRKNALDNGIKAKAVLDLGIENIFDDKINTNNKRYEFGYSFKASSEFIFGYGSGVFRGIAEFEADTIRRNPHLYKAYATSKTGIQTTDYLYMLVGLRGGISDTPFFFDVAPFVEFFHPLESTTSDYWENTRDNIPFSMLGDYTLGAKLGAGVSTGIGTFYVDFYFGASDNFRCSLMLGLK